MNQPSTSVELLIDGMDCSSCANGIEKRLKALGIADAVVDFATSSAHFSLPDTSVLPRVVSEIERLGYKPRTPHEQVAPTGFWNLERKFAVCLVFTLPLLLHMVISVPALHDPFVQLILCLPVFVISVLHFGRSAWLSVRGGVSNMDVLIIIGVVAAFGYSLYGTLMGLDLLYYETAATITTIVLLGNLLEERAVKKTTTAIEELSKIQPLKARRIRGSGQLEQIEEVPVDSLHVGDILLVNEGDRIPVDGQVRHGGGAVDESMLTGESIPVEKEIGSDVVAGTTLVNGNVRMEAQALGQDTVLANMVRLVREAQYKRPTIQRLGDQVSSVFVPVVGLIALMTFILSWGLGYATLSDSILRSIAVLVVACPCAMGLATPTAIMVGIGLAARNGILIKGGDTLERLARVETLVFDKTGTLTTGAFRVRDFTVYGMDEERVKAAIVGLENHSSHPIAKSLRDAFSGVTPLSLSELDETRGLGVSGKTAAGDTFTLRSNRDGQAGADLVVEKNGNVVASLVIEDELKPNATAAFESIRRGGYRTVLLSGDRRRKCEQLAQPLGIQEIYSEFKPEQKLTKLHEIEEQSPTAFIGDGINDAPALAAARVGISLSNASHIAVQAAQVVLLNGNLAHLPQALAISRSTLRVIKQNLFWAFFYNCLGIPLAALGILSPIFGALAMAFSDVMVIGNSLRLKLRGATEL